MKRKLEKIEEMKTENASIAQANVELLGKIEDIPTKIQNDAKIQDYANIQDGGTHPSPSKESIIGSQSEDSIQQSTSDSGQSDDSIQQSTAVLSQSKESIQQSTAALSQSEDSIQQSPAASGQSEDSIQQSIVALSQSEDSILAKSADESAAKDIADKTVEVVDSQIQVDTLRFEGDASVQANTLNLNLLTSPMPDSGVFVRYIYLSFPHNTNLSIYLQL